MASPAAMPATAATSSEYPKYTIDLDLPPRQRWNHVAKEYVAIVPDLLAAYEHALKVEFGAFGFLTKLMAKTLALPKHYKEEMQGLADACGLPYVVVLCLNVGYDFVARCTSGVVRVEDTVYHVRNMDWDLDALRKFTMQVTYTRGGKPLFTNVQWLGWIGAYTAVSPKGYSISLNYRKAGGGLLPHLLKAMVSCEKVTVGMAVRDLLERQLPFDEFVAGLRSADLLAPCYLTVASADMGMVIARGAGAKTPVRVLPELVAPGAAAAAPTTDAKMLANERVAAVMQTNHDAWCHGRKDLVKWAAGDPLLLNTEDRAACAMASLAGLAVKGGESREAVQAALAGVMLKAPVFNSMTIYSVIMVPATGAVVKVH